MYRMLKEKSLRRPFDYDSWKPESVGILTGTLDVESNRAEHLEPERLPTFIISVGTQVVLKSTKRVPGSDTVKPAGSVAEVLEAPAGNSRPYLIRFVDGATMRVKFAELVIRKRELDEELVTPGPDLRQFVILRVAVGSQAFGLATDASDEDRRGVFLPPADLTWSLFKPPEQVEYASDGIEEVDWELEKFLRLASRQIPISWKRFGRLWSCTSPIWVRNCEICEHRICPGTCTRPTRATFFPSSA